MNNEIEDFYVPERESVNEKPVWFWLAVGFAVLLVAWVIF